MKINRQIKLGLILTVGIGLLALLPTKVRAEELPAHYFEVLPVLEAHNHVGYFEFKNQPGYRDKVLKVKIYNPGATTVKIVASVNDATTDDSLMASYNTPQQVDHRLLKQPLTKYVKSKQSVYRLKPGQTKYAKFIVHYPQKQFKGVLAGGINLTTAQYSRRQARQVSLRNRFGYVIGVVMQGQALKQFKRPELTHVTAKTINSRTVLATGLTNPNPQYLRHAQVTTTLVNTNNPFYSYSVKQTKRMIAPQSTFNQLIPMNGKRLVTGIYRAKTTIIVGKHHWQIAGLVSVTRHQVRLLNQKDVDYLHRLTIIKWAAVCVGIISVIIGVGSLILKRKEARING